jgi:hypothetical protein
MDGRITERTDSHRLEALICSAVGWQVDELHVLECGSGLVLTGHARSMYARMAAVAEAERLVGGAVEDRMAVY